VLRRVRIRAVASEQSLPEREEFRRITLEEGLKKAIEWRDARFRRSR